MRVFRLVVAATLLALALSACTDNGTRTGPSSSATARPPGPAADLSQELRGGNGPFIGSTATVDLAAVGYAQHEYAASGTAVSYSSAIPLPGDGRWTFTPAGSAPYRTRVLVRAPTDPAHFSGTVVVEWLNVSGGVDADPEWASLHEEITRRGDVWVGVSAQRAGVMGGPVLVPVPGAAAASVAGKGLVHIDPTRYGSLRHPGDGFSFDIYTQVARALRTGAGLRGLRPARLIAAGESQSAYALVTYYDGVQPLTRTFDGFFVHSRGATSLPLVGPGAQADLASAIGSTPVIFRTDQAAPVLDLQSETDLTSVLDSYAARQPDNSHLRLWEVAGTAHADAHLLGAQAQAIDCGVPINNGPMHLVAKAALRALTTWLVSGSSPRAAPRIEVAAGSTPQIVRNGDGIALGGVRTPPVDVPIATLSAVPGPTSSVICLLLGTTVPLPAARLAQLYPSRSVYLQRYAADAARTIAAGWVLAQDRAALLTYAEPATLGG